MLPDSIEILSRDAGLAALDFVPDAIDRPRTREHGRPLTEWWVLKKLICEYPDKLPFSFPARIEKSERPDFLWHAEGRTLGLEITQATSPIDQQQMIKRPRGVLSGRGRHGYQGNLPERQVIADILKAMRRKRNLARSVRFPVYVIGYANSDPAQVLNIEVFSAMASNYVELLSRAVSPLHGAFFYMGRPLWLDFQEKHRRVIVGQFGHEVVLPEELNQKVTWTQAKSYLAVDGLSKSYVFVLH